MAPMPSRPMCRSTSPCRRCCRCARGWRGRIRGWRCIRSRPISWTRLGCPPRSRACRGSGSFPARRSATSIRPRPAASLRWRAARLGTRARFLVGADLRKDPSVLLPAYDDAAGVTAAFNRNLLVRLNREAGADFDVEAFAHRAVWNDAESRIEMHLVSRGDQTVRVAGQHDPLRARRDHPHREQLQAHARTLHRDRGRGRLACRAMWTDPARLVRALSAGAAHDAREATPPCSAAARR